jgi:hypothetical protein
MMTPSVSVSRKVAVDATHLTEEVSPVRMSILLLYMYTYRQIHYCHTSLTLVTQEVEGYKQHTCSNPIEMVGNPRLVEMDAARRAFLSPDTMTLLVLFREECEVLSLVRQIRSSRIVRTALEH